MSKKLHTPSHKRWKAWYDDICAHYIKHPYIYGPHASEAQHNDAKHNLFSLSRYKFCARMLHSKRTLLEIGCGDGIGIDIIVQEVKPEQLTCVDFDSQVLVDTIRRFQDHTQVRFIEKDIVTDTVYGPFDGAYTLDVIEHIEPSCEEQFMHAVVSSLTSDGVCIIGTPNITAHAYAGKDSSVMHINLKGEAELRTLMAQYFLNVFIFSMNDEVVHTGFSPMAHYLLAVGVGKRGG